MAMTLHNVSHLFQRCPCKMMSVSETGIHMMKAHETMGCMVLKERFLCDVSCPLQTWPQDRSCCFHASSHRFNMDAGEGREANPIISSICCGVTHCSITILPSDEDDWMMRLRSSHFYQFQHGYLMNDSKRLSMHLQMTMLVNWHD